MKYALILLVTLALAACGGDPYSAPPKGNKPAAANAPTQQNSTSEAKPTGPSQAEDYDKSARAAFAAFDTYKNEKNAANLAKWGTHLHDALRYSIIHMRNGHSSAKFYRLTDLKEMRTDFKYASNPGHPGWRDDPEFQAAEKAYLEVQQ